MCMPIIERLICYTASQIQRGYGNIRDLGVSERSYRRVEVLVRKNVFS